jgi:hypothetical protein
MILKTGRSGAGPAEVGARVDRNSSNSATASSSCYFTCQPRVRTNLRGVVQSICTVH